jgi:hypothetical protein
MVSVTAALFVGAQAAPAQNNHMQKVDLLAGGLSGWVEEFHPRFREKAKDGSLTAFSFDDGVLHCDGSVGNIGFLRTKGQFCNFELEAEFRAAAGANNGICFRAPVYDQKTPAHTGFELQILLRETDEPKGVNGALYSVNPPRTPVTLQPGAWHRVRIRAQGSRIQAWMNETLVQDFDHAAVPETSDRLACGHLFVQSHGGDTDFRKLVIRELPATR